MQATIRKAYVSRFQRFIKVGEWKIINTFSLSTSTRKYMISKLNYRMSFTNSTTISRSDEMSNNVFLDLADFAEVKSSLLDENILIGK